MKNQLTHPRSIILHSALALISILLFATPQAKADDSACLSNGYIGSYITGYATEVDVEGATAYIVSEGVIYIIDITDPASPELLNWIYISSSYEGTVILDAEGSNLFVGFSASRHPFNRILFIYDVSDPSSPSLISSTYEPEGGMRSFHIANQTLYIRRGSGVAMETVDISDLQNPTQSAFVLYPEEAGKYRMRGSIAYIINQGTGLSILDLSDPANPVPLGSIGITGTAYSFDVDGDAVYINVLEAGKLTGIQVIDVSNLESPEHAGVIPLTLESYRGIRVEGDDLYVLLGSSVGFNVFDISDPALPTLKGIYDAQSNYWDLEIIDSTVYLASDLAGLQIVDVNDLPTESPFLGEFVVEQDRVEDVQVIGTTAYIADGFQGLEIIDVTDPTDPILLGQYDTIRSTHQIEVRGTIGYLKTFGLDVIDVSDPSSPTLITNYPVDGYFNALAIHGTIAYIANSEIEGIQIVDFSNPASPVLLGIFSAAGYARGIEIVNNKAYVFKSNALLILDVSIPESPALLGTYKTDRYFGQKIAVDGTTVYLEHSPASYRYELAVIDASDPTSPQLITTKPMAQNILAIDIADHKAYISVAWVGMIILDLTNPFDPIQIGSYHHGGAAIDVVNDTAYIAMGYVAGLQIVDVSDCPPCPADLNDDGLADFLDISAFLDAFTTADPLADLNNDGQTDFLDISAFLTSYSTGCP